MGGAGAARAGVWGLLEAEAGAQTVIAGVASEGGLRFGSPMCQLTGRLAWRPRAPYAHQAVEIDQGITALVALVPPGCTGLELRRAGDAFDLLVHGPDEALRRYPLHFVRGNADALVRGEEAVLRLAPDAVDAYAEEILRQSRGWLEGLQTRPSMRVSDRVDPRYPAELELGEVPLLRVERGRLMIFVEALDFSAWVFVYDAARQDEVQHLLPEEERR